MALSPRLLAGAAFAGAAVLAVAAARTVTATLEDRSATAVRAELAADALDWVTVTPDGLMVVLEGEAPTEAARFEAISAAGRAVDGARVIDSLRVAAAEAVAAPDFALEILRNDAGVQLIGLVPTGEDRDAVARAVADAAGAAPVADLLESADHPVPAGWEDALGFALDALPLLPQARLSVAPGRVTVEALAETPEAARALESELARLAPAGLHLGVAVESPRPAIAPFVLRATLRDGALALDACSAASEDDARRLAQGTGAACRVGLGAPSPAWADAALAGLDALRELGGGTLAMSDADVALTAPAGTEPDRLAEVAAALDAALPAPFALRAEAPPAPVAADAAPEGPPEMRATLDAEGRVRLSGPIEDPRMAELALAFAQARFGADRVTSTLRPRDGLPEGWTLRVLAGLEALSPLAEGSVAVAPDRVAVAGRTGDEAARDAIAARAAETLGAGARIDLEVAYDEALDPLAALPSPEECLARITAVTDAAKVTFEPGSDTISQDGEPVIEAIAEILRACPDLRLLIAGYTDSQGGEDTNLRLSQSRAEAVLAALRAQRVPVAGFEARGFGEAAPIASNDSEEGREANRRIEFSLLGEESGGGEAGGPAAAAPADGPATLTVSAPGMAKPDAPPLRPEGFAEAAREALDDDAFASLTSPDPAPVPQAPAAAPAAPGAPAPGDGPAAPSEAPATGEADAPAEAAGPPAADPDDPAEPPAPPVPEDRP